MKAALRAEHRKLVSTPLWWVLLIVSAAYLALIGAALAFSISADDASTTPGIPSLDGVDAASSVFSLVNAIGYVFPLVIGSLAMTSEFRYRTITQSVLVEPDRTTLLIAKLLATIPLGLLYGVVGVAAVVAGGAPVLAWRGDGAFLTDGAVVPVLLLGVVVTALWAVLGVAFGSVVSNQVAAIVIILAVTQLVEPAARLGLGAVDALDEVGQFLPGAAADAVMGAGFFNQLGDGALLPRWAGLVVFAGYAVVLAVIGRNTTLRRDIG
ncbi:MAG: ABC transporter permease [Ilumatobacteraceae bacterium]